MFRSFDEYGGYDIENPMVIDRCTKTTNWYDDDEIVNVFFGIDTSNLTLAEENELIDKLEEMSFKENRRFDVTPIEKLGDETEQYGYVEVYGRASDWRYDDLIDVINSYDVAYSEVRDF